MRNETTDFAMLKMADGLTWEAVAEAGLDNSGGQTVWGLHVFDGNLYAHDWFSRVWVHQYRLFLPLAPR